MIRVEPKLWPQRFRETRVRLAVVWIGWFLVVNFAILWFSKPDASATTGDIENVMILLMLGHGVILIGVGLATVDHLEKASRQNTAVSQMVAELVERNRRLETRTLALQEDRSRTIATGEIDGRPLKVRLDGTVEVLTLLGPRRFRNVADTLEFVGTG